jgi:hypothetical protein
MPKRSDRWHEFAERWGTVAGVASNFASAFGLFFAAAGLFFTGIQTQQATEESRVAATFNGIGVCVAYRDQLFKLFDRGMTIDEIAKVYQSDKVSQKIEGNCGDPSVILQDAQPIPASGP